MTALERAFSSEGFKPLPRPGPNDWLSAHPEPGQTFEEFVRSRPNRPDRARPVLYLVPLGDFPAEASPNPERLRAYAGAFFSMPVRLLSPLPLAALKATARVNRHTGKRQLLAGDILAHLKGVLPADAFCIVAFTMEDLYPEPSWNFVFGQASLRERVGVYSFARYDPAFYGERRSADHSATLLRRSLKVLVHEAGHMFGLHHCVYFSCVFNGSNHLAEADARPLHACPVCLRKLHYGIGFDPAARYAALERFYRDAGLNDAAAWVAERLRALRARAAASE